MSDTMPKRIQRQRTKGWRMPENTIYVGRPSRWGNPFRVGDPSIGGSYTLDDSLRLYRIYMGSDWSAMTLAERIEARRWAQFHDSVTTESARLLLKGSDLACWCPLDQPCHADILLEIANA